MPRNRVIYQSEAVYAGPVSGAAPQYLKRVQSCNYNFSIKRTDINQFGQLASIDRLILEEPTVAVDLTYYFTPDVSSRNEENLGLDVGGSHMLGSIASGVADKSEKNIYIVTSSPGVDMLGGTAAGVIGIGNCFLTSWSLEAAVGTIPTVSCAFEGQNMTFAATPSIVNPAIDSAGVAFTGTVSPSGGSAYLISEISAVRPGNITLLLGTSDSDNSPMVGLLESDLKIQSATVAMTLSREPLRKLGKHYAFARELTFPIMCTMTVNAIVGDTVLGQLATLTSPIGAAVGDTASFEAKLTLSAYSNASPTPVFSSSVFTLRKCKLDSQNMTSSIGANKSVVLTFSSQIGVGSGLVMT